MTDKVVEGKEVETTVEISAAAPNKDGEGSGDQYRQVSVDPLAIGQKFKKDGDFVVAANYDPTLSPAYKNLNDQHVALTQAITKEREKTEQTVRQLTEQLSQNKTMAAEEKDQIGTRLNELETSLTLTMKEAEAARVDLLKVQTAASKGLPYSYIKYVKGSTADEIAKSVEEVANDFKLQTHKHTSEELDLAVKAAAELARTETEEALKTRGKNTEGAGQGDHIFTRSEILVMPLDVYKANRTEIERQANEGLIK
jgi:archaellin